MKRYFFALLLLLSVVTAGKSIAFADVYLPGNVGNYEFNYTEERGETTTTYNFEFIASGYPVDSDHQVRWYDSEGNDNYLGKLTVRNQYDDNGDWLECISTGSWTLSNDLDIDHFTVKFGYQHGSVSWTYYELGATCQETSIVDPPVITPEITPEVTPDVEEPTPEITPEITPEPTPTEAPILELNAFVTSKDAVAQYKTGGCTPVRSTIEFYEVDTAADILSKINSEQFISGSGTMRNTMTPGKVYRYKLTYVYQRDGIQYEKFLWSDDLTIVDQELEDYRSNKRITNFRTLMLYVWEDVMSLELPIEGFNISFQTWYIWLMVALALIWFIKKYNS